MTENTVCWFVMIKKYCSLAEKIRLISRATRMSRRDWRTTMARFLRRNVASSVLLKTLLYYRVLCLAKLDTRPELLQPTACELLCANGPFFRWPLKFLNGFWYQMHAQMCSCSHASLLTRLGYNYLELVYNPTLLELSLRRPQMIIFLPGWPRWKSWVHYKYIVSFFSWRT